MPLPAVAAAAGAALSRGLLILFVSKVIRLCTVVLIGFFITTAGIIDFVAAVNVVLQVQAVIPPDVLNAVWVVLPVYHINFCLNLLVSWFVARIIWSATIALK